jgi:tetratricopeptide (TPR) repeat protein
MREPLPDYVHERLYDLAAAMTEAHESGSAEAEEELYEELRDYCLALIDEGKEHSHLWETLADFTPDDEQALEYYERALVAAERDEAPIQGIVIGLGERHASLEHFGEARELLTRGLHLAIEAGDSAMATRADVLLNELPS